nr:immunoglobulin heavy chain junction region [Mus musculus]
CASPFYYYGSMDYW